MGPSHVIDGASGESGIRPEVRLEIGPLGSWVPSTVRSIRPYASDVLPKLFEKPDCEVLTITPERTFWEKATILHKEAHRTTRIQQRHSRHYYDLYKLAISPIRSVALADLTLLQDVVSFKQRFYPVAWARYDLAVRGSFRLLPATTTHTRDLELDYRDMQLMIFGQAPEFERIIDELCALQEQINA